MWPPLHFISCSWISTTGRRQMHDIMAMFSFLFTPSCVSALTLGCPFVWLQHQVLFGLFQFFLQTLVLGSDFTDSLLAVLQQTKLGTDIHHLLTQRERTDRYGFYSPLFIQRSVLWNTCGSVSAAACLTFTLLHTFTPHWLSVWP